MTDLKPTAFVQIEKIVERDGFKTTEFFDGYAWDTDAQTIHAFRSAETKHEVPFEHAAYLVDLYEKEGELLDTFPMAELGYRSLKAHGS